MVGAVAEEGEVGLTIAVDVPNGIYVLMLRLVPEVVCPPRTKLAGGVIVEAGVKMPFFESSFDRESRGERVVLGGVQGNQVG